MGSIAGPFQSGHANKRLPEYAQVSHLRRPPAGWMLD